MVITYGFSLDVSAFTELLSCYVYICGSKYILSIVSYGRESDEKTL